MVDQAAKRVLRNSGVFVLAAVDGTFGVVGFVEVHGVTDAEAAHEVADAGFLAPQVFA